MSELIDVVAVTFGCVTAVGDLVSGGGDDAVVVDVREERSEGAFDIDVEGVWRGLLVAASVVGLCEGLFVALGGKVVEGWIDDDSLPEDLRDAELTSVLCEGICALDGDVVEDLIEDASVVEDLEDVAGVSIDVVSGLDDVDECGIEDDPLPDSLLESIEDVASSDVVLNLFDVGEDRLDDIMPFEEAGVDCDVCLRLDEALLERDIVEVVVDTENVDDDFIPESLEVGEDRVDGTLTFEDDESVAGIDVDFASRLAEVVEGTEEEPPTELFLCPKIAANTEDTNSEPFEREVDDRFAIDGEGDAVTPDVAPKPDTVPELGFPLGKDEEIRELNLDG